MTEEQQKLIKFFEGEFICSGLCKPNLFYFSLSIEKGKPIITCVESLMEKVNDDILLLGLVYVSIAITMFCILGCQYPLWCFNKEAFENDKKIKQIENE